MTWERSCCFVLSILNYLLQIAEIKKLAKLLLELRLGYRLVIQELDSVLFYLEANNRREERNTSS